MLSCCQTASRLRNGKNCCSLKITEGGISPRVSASPGQQNEFSHPVIPNIRDIRGAESNGDRGVTLGSHVPRFTMREKSSFANTANGCNVTLRARELFLLVNLHFFFPVASRLSLILPSPPLATLLVFLAALNHVCIQFSCFLEDTAARLFQSFKWLAWKSPCYRDSVSYNGSVFFSLVFFF